MNLIGLMSGTSLDGLDIAFCQFSPVAENEVNFEIMYAQTLPYSQEWAQRLATLHLADALTFVQTDRDLGRYMGEAVATFCKKYQVRPDYVASHGHTIFHQPEKGITAQIGYGAAVAAACQFPVVCDFRSLDVALGGQGAPLVPIGDKLLFSQYDYCINLGGIANISFDTATGSRVAFDICPANMILNAWAQKLGKPYDYNGQWAATGSIDENLLQKLNALPFYTQIYPKSLGREWVELNFIPLLEQSGLSEKDVLATVCRHIAMQVARSLTPKSQAKSKIMITGGGALNQHLAKEITTQIGAQGEVIVPNEKIINFKEALIFAFLGMLRVHNKINCLQSVTGASRDNVGGVIYTS